jgi:hypothetical protein
MLRRVWRQMSPGQGRSQQRLVPRRPPGSARFCNTGKPPPENESTPEHDTRVLTETCTHAVENGRAHERVRLWNGVRGGVHRKRFPLQCISGIYYICDVIKHVVHAILSPIRPAVACKIEADDGRRPDVEHFRRESVVRSRVVQEAMQRQPPMLPCTERNK